MFNINFVQNIDISEEQVYFFLNFLSFLYLYCHFFCLTVPKQSLTSNILPNMDTLKPMQPQNDMVQWTSNHSRQNETTNQHIFNNFEEFRTKISIWYPLQLCMEIYMVNQQHLEAKYHLYGFLPIQFWFWFFSFEVWHLKMSIF